MKKPEMEEYVNEGPGTLPSAERRRFLAYGLKVTGVFLGGTILSLVPDRKAGGSVLGVGVTGTFPYQPHYSIAVRLAKCVGCGKCKEACEKINNVPAYGYRISLLQRQTHEGGSVNKNEFLPVFCNQCNRPPCVSTCPSKATYKDSKTGIVMMDEELCIGCKACITACPYNARYFNDEIRAIDKCDFCYRSRLVSGKSTPACVESCPFGVFVFGDLSDQEGELSAMLNSAGNMVLVLRPEKGTMPNVFYIKDKT